MLLSPYRLTCPDMCLQVYISAIEGHVPAQMVRTFSAYIDIYYLVRRPVINEDCLAAIREALDRFYHYRQIFQETGVREPGPAGFSLPRQHALKHYREHIPAFGAPNGLCSSITESMHIRAVKKPYRRSSRFRPLGQMLQTNDRLDKLTIARRDFRRRGMLHGSCLTNALEALKPCEDSNDDHDSSTDDSNSTNGNGDYVNDSDDDDSDDDGSDDDDSDDDDNGPIDGPKVLNHVTLAKKPGE
jgi:hypothetical protein